MPFQHNHFEKMMSLIKTRNVSLDTSDTGTGKTYITVQLCKKLGMMPMIICPKAVIPTWKKVCELFGVQFFGISNDVMFKKGVMYYSDINKKGPLKQYKIPYYNPETGIMRFPKEINGISIQILLVIDEAHRFKNPSTQNAQILLAAHACR